MSSEIKKEYDQGEVTVIWKPAKCIHAKECVSRLPQVYDPNKRPWIEPSNATAQELIDQIKACPSGALTYRMNNDTNPKEQTPMNSQTKCQVLANGPLLVHGTIEIEAADGSTQTKEDTTAFCRCGASANKPFCDGAHNKVGFEG